MLFRAHSRHDYLYGHDQPEAFSGQDYFPGKTGRQTFYDPSDRGFERDIRKRLDYRARSGAIAPTADISVSAL